MAFDYKEKFSVAGKKCIVTGAAQAEYKVGAGSASLA